jgi:hypothetical protein
MVAYGCDHNYQTSRTAERKGLSLCCGKRRCRDLMTLSQSIDCDFCDRVTRNQCRRCHWTSSLKDIDDALTCEDLAHALKSESPMSQSVALALVRGRTEWVERWIAHIRAVRERAASQKIQMFTAHHFAFGMAASDR